MKTFVANGATAIDIDKFELKIHRTTAGVTSKSLIIKDVSGSFSVSHKTDSSSEVSINKNLCIVSRNRIITGIKIEHKESNRECSNYNFTGTDIQPYGS